MRHVSRTRHKGDGTQHLKVTVSSRHSSDTSQRISYVTGESAGRSSSTYPSMDRATSCTPPRGRRVQSRGPLGAHGAPPSRACTHPRPHSQHAPSVAPKSFLLLLNASPQSVCACIYVCVCLPARTPGQPAGHLVPTFLSYRTVPPLAAGAAPRGPCVQSVQQTADCRSHFFAAPTAVSGLRASSPTTDGSTAKVSPGQVPLCVCVRACEHTRITARACFVCVNA